MTALSIEQQRAIALAQARRRRSESESAPEQPVYRSPIFPLSNYGDGDVRFDLGSGITGAIGRTISAPGEAMRGELQVMDGQGRLTDEAIGRSLEFAGVTLPVNPALRAGDRAIPGAARSLQRPRADSPSAESLRQAAGGQYRQMRATGATYPSDDMVRMARTTMARMNQDGFNEATAPRTFGTLQRLTDPPEGSFGTIDGLQSARRTFGRLRQQTTDPTEADAASQAIRGLDEFIQTPSVAPTAAQGRASSLLQEANGNYSAAMRSREIGGIERAAELRSAAANSGQNLGNQIRQRVASALLSRRPLSGYTPDEIQVLEQIIMGTTAQNATRFTGNMLGGGGGLGGVTAAGLGGMAGASVAGPVGAGVGAAATALTGRAMRSVSNSLTERALRQADDMIRRRSPLYRQMLRQVPAEGRSPERRMALVRALMAIDYSNMEWSWERQGHQSTRMLD